MTGLHMVRVLHQFEAAHRIRSLGGKCRNMHGHSWRVGVQLAAPVLRDGVVVELGAFKRALWGWVDEFLDHGAMLTADDPRVPDLLEEGSKVYQFDHPRPSGPEVHAAGLLVPSVECVAQLMARVATEVLADLPPAVPVARGAYVAETRVRETAGNIGIWTAGCTIP